jgi:hypothetical protein
MKHYLLSLLFVLSFCKMSIAQHVFYGERDLLDSTSVFFDKDGVLYPDYFIRNDSLKSYGSSLQKWYASKIDTFISVGRLYNCDFKTYSRHNLEILNDSIIAKLAARINSLKEQFSSVTFLIHGYRKPYPNPGDYTSSPQDYKILQDSISHYKKKPTSFIKVYWDGMYGCCFGKNLSVDKYLLALFEEAQRNADATGKSFGQLLLHINFDTVNIVTHSLGAEIAITSLFNVHLSDSIIITPSIHRINICLIAPAIAGVEKFENYYNRKSTVNFKTNDNYRLAVAYNENDFVLRKKYKFFGPGPYKYGVTTLGCNFKGAATNLKSYFATTYKKSYIQLFNLSDAGGCHLVSCYCDTDEFENLCLFLDK